MAKKTKVSRPDPVGVKELSVRLGVKERTGHQWIHRSLLPAPEYAQVNGSRAWEWETILRWAGESGHIVSAEAADEFERLAGRPPAPRRGVSSTVVRHRVDVSDVPEVEFGQLTDLGRRGIDYDRDAPGAVEFRASIGEPQVEG